MRRTQAFSSWVVYRKTAKGNSLGGSVVCGQEEWYAIEQAEPGTHTLVLAGITSEKEAERLARGSSGDAYKSRTMRKD